MRRLLACFATGLVVSSGSPTCVDLSGAPVDWWFLYKHPRWEEKGHDVCVGNCAGNTYAFLTSASNGAWQTTGPVVNDTASLLGRQLSGIYAGTVPNYVFYNDQLPDGSWSTTYGHSKGFFGFDDTSAFWVQHSIPKFPNYVADGYAYGEGQMWYGQHAFCLTLSPAQLNEAAGVMLYAYPQVYDHALAADAGLANVSAVVAGDQMAGSVGPAVVTPTWGALSLFGKAAAADVDMLDALVAPGLHVPLRGQSWLNSGGPLGSFCPSSGYNVTDILEIALPPDDTHVTYNDHSKWAVDPRADGSGWFCALDNNHVASQETRSGLAVCVQLPALAASMRAAATSAGECGKGNEPPPPPPPPPPGACCYYSDPVCSAGQTCCSGSGKSYSSEGTCERYGAAHHCVWDSDDARCFIPKNSSAHHLPLGVGGAAAVGVGAVAVLAVGVAAAVRVSRASARRRSALIGGKGVQSDHVENERM